MDVEGNGLLQRRRDPSYVGRFAPSPTGPLHAGSLVAALGSWLDARAHGGRWIVRIEDLDAPRCVPGADETILAQLAACGLTSDDPVTRQSRRTALYDAALATLVRRRWAYPCSCSRRDVDAALRARGIVHQPDEERVYPGTCRRGAAASDRPVAWRVRTTREPEGDEPLVIEWSDRRLGVRRQDVTNEVGDFIVKRVDGSAAYQLAVVVDDAAQGVSDVVRGQDLADNTPRQIHLQRLLALPLQRYLHLPLVLGTDGRKLSKQNGAQPLDASDPLGALRGAGSALGLDIEDAAIESVGEWLRRAVRRWGERAMRPSAARGARAQLLDNINHHAEDH